MTQEQFEKRIQDKIRTLKAGQIIFPAAQHALDSLNQRLFMKGIGGNGQPLGQYSTNPMYASASIWKNKSRYKPQGKNVNLTKNGKRKPGSGTFANGNPRKSMYLPQGYKQLRELQGYETGFVNLQYAGDLYDDFRTKLTPEKDSVVLRIDPLSAKKVQWLSKKYGPQTFKHTEQEREEFGKNVLKELVKYFQS